MIAISDSTGGLHNPNGHRRRRRRSRTRRETRHARRAPRRRADHERGAARCSTCDVLAPCALEQVIHAGNADQVQAPRSSARARTARRRPTADEILEDAGVLVLPDILANAGGVVVSYFEWVQGLQEYFWKEAEVNAKLNDIVTRAFNETWDDARARGTTHADGRLRARGPARRRGDRPRAASTRNERSRRPLRRHGLPPLRARARDGRGRAGRELASSSTEVDITGDPELEARYRELLPVVEIDGERAFVYHVPPEALRRALGAQTRRSRPACDFPRRRLSGAGRLVVRLLQARREERRVADRLTVGVAARLSRYLQVLTQAKKMGKDRISSQEISDYTNINATQIRRDLSGVRQVRQARRRLQHRLPPRRDPQDPPHPGPAQHRARRRGPARPGDRELADLRRARHQHRGRLRHRPGEGRPRASATSRSATTASLPEVVRDKNIIVGVLAVPADSAQEAADDLVDAGREDHLQLLRGAARRAGGRHRAHVEPGGRAAHALYFHLT